MTDHPSICLFRRHSGRRSDIDAGVERARAHLRAGPTVQHSTRRRAIFDELAGEFMFNERSAVAVAPLNPAALAKDILLVTFQSAL